MNEKIKTEECHTSYLGMTFRNWYLPGRQECSLPSTDQLKLYAFKKKASYNDTLCKRKILEHIRENGTYIKRICETHIKVTEVQSFSKKKEFTVYR